MRVAAFIPIKARSERVPGKNLRELGGRSLYRYIIDTALDAFGDVYVDTDSGEIAAFAGSRGCDVISRLPELRENSANGNDLLRYHREQYPDYDIYCQLFATAPFLMPDSIKACIDAVKTGVYDSAMTVTADKRFCWYDGCPVTYERWTLPRSQDMQSLVTETTGCYVITGTALDKYMARMGSSVYMHNVSKREAIDIDTEEDWAAAEAMVCVQ